MCGWQIKLYYPSLTLAVPEHFRDEFLMINRHTNPRLLYLLYILRSYGFYEPPYMRHVVDASSGSMQAGRLRADTEHTRCKLICTYKRRDEDLTFRQSFTEIIEGFRNTSDLNNLL